ncbi:MAG: hypothetical protein KAV82_03140 [Phycisphaerae bacterium]|nr:hypothetical protein [Phycisphaerae bacterium]
MLLFRRTIVFCIVGGFAIIVGAERVQAVDCNGNGVDDAQDIAAGTSQDCQSNGIPDECDISEISPLDVTWFKVPENPVIPGTEPYVGWYRNPCVIYDDGIYKMWTGSDRDIKCSTSPDGVDWSYPPEVCGPALDTYGFNSPCVIKDGDVYKMWYKAWDGSGVWCGSWFEYATSPDGDTWTKYGPVLECTPGGPTYDHWSMSDPSVIKDGPDSYKMYYSAQSGGTPNQLTVALATSSDGVAWEKWGVVLEADGTGFDAEAVNCSEAFFENGVYYLLYGGRATAGAEPTILGIAWSTDGYTFTKLDDPYLELGGPEDFDNHSTGAVASLLHIGDQYWLWYTGLGDGNDWDYIRSIGLATAFAGGTSQDCNSNGVPDECDLIMDHNCCETGSGPGCSDPAIEDCVCQIDRYCCLTLWDEICVDEVLSLGCGTCEPISSDCQPDGIPDECQLVDNDCNTNAVPDDCEADFDGDGLIDGCDSDIDDDGVSNQEDACNYTPLGANIVTDPQDPLYGTLRGDLDGDCDCDLADYAILQADFTGPNG